MNRKYEYLFQPIKVGPMRLKNRITSRPSALSSPIVGLQSFPWRSRHRPRSAGGASLINMVRTLRIEYFHLDLITYSLGNHITINWLSRVVETITPMMPR